MQDNTRRQFATALAGMLVGAGTTEAGMEPSATQTQISTVTRVGCLNKLQFPTSVAEEAFEKIIRSFHIYHPARSTIFQAFANLMAALENVVERQESSDSIFNALFDLNTVIAQSGLPAATAAILFSSASGIFCSLVCDPTPSGAAPGFQYILKDWFVSDFEFRLDTCRVQVTCIYTCRPVAAT